MPNFKSKLSVIPSVIYLVGQMIFLNAMATPPPLPRVDDTTRSDQIIIDRLTTLLLEDSVSDQADTTNNWMPMIRVGLGLPEETRDRDINFNRPIDFFTNSNGRSYEIKINHRPYPLRGEYGDPVIYRNFPVVEFVRHYSELQYPHRNTVNRIEYGSAPVFDRRINLALLSVLGKIQSREQLFHFISEKKRGLFNYAIDDPSPLKLVASSVLDVRTVDLLSFLCREFVAESYNRFSLLISEKEQQPLTGLIEKRDADNTEVLPRIKIPLLADWLLQRNLSTGADTREELLSLVQDYFGTVSSMEFMGEAAVIRKSHHPQVDKYFQNSLIGWIRLAHYLAAWQNSSSRIRFLSSEEVVKLILVPVVIEFRARYQKQIKQLNSLTVDQIKYGSLGRESVIIELPLKLEIIALNNLLDAAKTMRAEAQTPKDRAAVNEIEEFIAKYAVLKENSRAHRCALDLL